MPHYRTVLNEVELNPAQPLNTERFGRLPLLCRGDELRVESLPPYKRQLAEALRSRIRSHLKFAFSHHDHIPRHANGQFERFICHVTATDGSMTC